jgi:hypothetical protein
VREFAMVRSGNVWHGFVQGLPGSNVRYTYVAASLCPLTKPPHNLLDRMPLWIPLALRTKQRRAEAITQHSTADDVKLARRRRYRVDGKGGWETGSRWDPMCYLLDPYAPLVASRPTFGEGGGNGGDEGWWCAPG